MGDTNEYTVHDLVRDELYKNMDVEYGKFTASLSPGAGNIRCCAKWRKRSRL